MAISKSAMEALMAPLRVKYQAQLKEWLSELEAILHHLLTGQCSPEERETLKRRTHGLFGSGSTYGFTDITHSAQALETELINYGDGNWNYERVAKLLQKLTVACARCVEEKN